MKILIADAFSESHLIGFQKLGLELDYRPQLSAAELPAAVAGVNILVVRSKQVSQKTIEAGTALSLIVRAGAGVNTIDIAAASARGVFVANCPGQNAIAVAELTIGLLVARSIAASQSRSSTCALGGGTRRNIVRPAGCSRRTLGVVGTGAIGQAVIARALAFGMNVVAWSRSLTPEKAHALKVTRAETLSSLCAQSDAVTVHVAYSPETHQLIGEAALSRMRHRAMLINTSRSEVVDSVALRQAVVDKGLRVALDVFEREPERPDGVFDDEIVKLTSVIGTHHIGASTEQAQSAIADETLRIVRGFVSSGEVQNCVNILPPPQTPARAELVVRHHDKVGVLAEVLGAIRRHNINVETMQNTIFQGAKAACARIRLGTRPSAELLTEIRSRSDEVIHVDVLELPEP